MESCATPLIAKTVDTTRKENCGNANNDTWRHGLCGAAHFTDCSATSTRFTARGLATLKIVEIHVLQSTNVDRRFRITAKAAANGIGDDAKPLTKLVDEAEGELPVANGRSDKKNTRNFCGLVVQCQYGCAG
jgi:hypothetical protein